MKIWLSIINRLKHIRLLITEKFESCILKHYHAYYGEGFLHDKWQMSNHQWIQQVTSICSQLFLVSNCPNDAYY